MSLISQIHFGKKVSFNHTGEQPYLTCFLHTGNQLHIGLHAALPRQESNLVVHQRFTYCWKNLTHHRYFVSSRSTSLLRVIHAGEKPYTVRGIPISAYAAPLMCICNSLFQYSKTDTVSVFTLITESSKSVESWFVCSFPLLVGPCKLENKFCQWGMIILVESSLS